MTIAPLLAVYAHPDDETLQAGALLALEASRRRVVVVTATRGERGEMIGTPQIEGTDEVAGIRLQERSAALAALGVTESYLLDELVAGAPVPDGGPAVGWTDSGMSWIAPGVAGPAPDATDSALSRGDLAAQAGALAGLVRRLRPSLVVCDEPGGAYGHPDHVRTHEITTAALDLAASPDWHPADTAGTAEPDAGPWVVPALGWVVHDVDRLSAAREQVAAAIEAEGATGEDGEPLTVETEALPSLARPSELVDVELDTTGVAGRLLAAMRCYPSQVQGATIPAIDRALRPGRGARALRPQQAAIGWFALSNGVAQPILPVVELQWGVGDAVAAQLPVAEPSVLEPSVLEPSVPQQAAAASTAPAPGAGRRGRAGRPPWTHLVVGFVLGVVAATAGTMLHRARLDHVPYGMVLAVAMVVLATALARSVGRGAGVVGSGLGVLLTVQALTYLGRGGDVLVAQDAYGLTWLALSLGGVLVGAFLPARWVGESGRSTDGPA